jgi:hypothetical protein
MGSPGAILSHIDSGCTPYDGESSVVRRPSSVGECGIIDLDLIIPMQPETISESRLINRIASLGPASGINRASLMRGSAIDLQAVDIWAGRAPINLLTIFRKKTCTLHKNLHFTQIHN